MSKMDTRLQHLSHGHAGHENLLFGLGLRASLPAILEIRLSGEKLGVLKDTQPSGM